MAPFTWAPRSTPDMCLTVMATPTSGGYPLVIYWFENPTCQLPKGHDGVHCDPAHSAQWSDHYNEVRGRV